MIIDMEKYRHGHCRNVSQSRGAAQGVAAPMVAAPMVAAQGVAAQVVGMAAAASVPAASVLEPIPFPGEVANVLKLNPVPTPFPGGGESRGTGRISPTIPRDAPILLPTLLCYGQCWQPCGQAASTAPAMR